MGKYKIVTGVAKEESLEVWLDPELSGSISLMGRLHGKQFMILEIDSAGCLNRHSIPEYARGMLQVDSNGFIKGYYMDQG
jgi:hypothetical protein